ncbi:LysR family transcriptional regulator [Deinococcus cellulosilyticus]|uniref:LysR family transcriptional regulator n=1 Tax=Deinococcus cellulosilyticus (strain DSM 18568 / NBRC 106333 / KACC 11606 / 5516J-15) TaxID=1223518 RepID=A0A511N990_DEIC1|nr:LysR family transcriptional regulator [Deinococcus cellulosilyticus]GEM49066.1 LysR family transcriptional regulator [Deinococcus cellulosilyticus NBRC 106333 = KACC 11606]
MSQMEWYRNFIAVYRAGSVSGAAKLRNLTQPAVSQQLALLEDAVGVPLFVRTPRGMLATEKGEALYAQVFEAIDKLERISRGIRRTTTTLPTIRLGAPAEYFHAYVLDRLQGLGVNFTVRFGYGRDLLNQLEMGTLDVALTTVKPTQKSTHFQVLSKKRFLLVGPSHWENPDPETSPEELGAWLNGQPWVNYSMDAPMHRRLLQHFGSRFEGQFVLTVPDLRTVLRSVELGYGLAVLPEFLCTHALQSGTIKEIWPVRDLVLQDQWMLSYREVDGDREEIHAIAAALRVPEDFRTEARQAEALT